jgi:hypothetical protein
MARFFGVTDIFLNPQTKQFCITKTSGFGFHLLVNQNNSYSQKCQKLIDLIPEIDKRNIWYASAFIASVYGSEDNYGGFGFKYN